MYISPLLSRNINKKTQKETPLSSSSSSSINSYLRLHFPFFFPISFVLSSQKHNTSSSFFPSPHHRHIHVAIKRKKKARDRSQIASFFPIMTKTEEDWVQMAMGDTCLVAHLLLRLVGDRPPSSRTWLDWTVRGRRSSTRALSKNPDGITKKEPTDKPARASPSTPLSWSGATSTSGGPSEESHPCPLDHCHAGRSKATSASSAPTIPTVLVTTAGKRPRQKKKSLFELKEEENSLLKERHCLKQELASLRLRVEEKRATNESLKRLKVNSISYEQERFISQSQEGNLRAMLPDLNLPLDEQQLEK